MQSFELPMNAISSGRRRDGPTLIMMSCHGQLEGGAELGGEQS